MCLEAAESLGHAGQGREDPAAETVLVGGDQGSRGGHGGDRGEEGLRQPASMLGPGQEGASGMVPVATPAVESSILEAPGQPQPAESGQDEATLSLWTPFPSAATHPLLHKPLRWGGAGDADGLRDRSSLCPCHASRTLLPGMPTPELRDPRPKSWRSFSPTLVPQAPAAACHLPLPPLASSPWIFFFFSFW